MLFEFSKKKLCGFFVHKWRSTIFPICGLFVHNSQIGVKRRKKNKLKINSKWLADVLELKNTLFVQIFFFHQFSINQENCHLNAKVGIDKEQNRIIIFFIFKWVGCSRRSRVEIPNFSCNPKIVVLNYIKLIVLNCSMTRLSEKESSPAGINVSSNNNIFSVVKDDRQTALRFI